MKRKKKTEPPGQYFIMWSSISKDGFRVKHRIWRDQTEGFEDCIWHTEIRLTNNPAILPQTYEVYPRKFFGKVWIAQRIEGKIDSTWKAIGEAVRQLELKEKGGRR